MKEINQLKVVLYGTGPLAESLLVTLVEGGLTPKLLVTKPDSKVGRSQKLQSPTIKHLADVYHIPVIQPVTLKGKVSEELQNNDFDIGIVASYGMILPDNVLAIPDLGTLNVHPSLLPLYRGPTPIESALIAGEDNLGISIMFLDDQIDHGPILLQNSYPDFSEITDGTSEVFEKLAGVRGGVMLLSEVLSPFYHGALVAKEQDHSRATFTKKLSKENGLVSLTDSTDKIYNVWRACTPWPGCYFMHSHNGKDLRIKITEMQKSEDLISITKVVPEGKKEMDFESFKNGYLK
jgi:methionyl-tRNA formyltransferase